MKKICKKRNFYVDKDTKCVLLYNQRYTICVIMGVKKIRYWLVDIRKSRNLTQEEVAKKANIARTTYAMIEQGERNPSVSVAKRIANVLGFEWTYFFEDEIHEMRTCEPKINELKPNTA